MDFDLTQIDTVLGTTRAVRKRLDLERPVPDQVLWDCIDLAEQAPTGGDLASRRWLIIRDPTVKAALAELYREAGGSMMMGAADRVRGTGHPREGVLTSGGYLAEVFERVPAYVLVTIWGAHDGSGNPGLFDSVVQAAWSFCLAARSRGLGTAWTTMHLARKQQVAELLRLPDGVTQIVLLPVAYTIGSDFGRAPRRPAAEITFLDRWGHTTDRPSADAQHHLDDGPGLTVEIDVDASPAAVWALVTDVTVPARYSGELQTAEWVDGAGPAVGSRFVGTNELEGFGRWQTTCTVVRCDDRRCFAWAVGDIDSPGATWRFELEPLGFGGRQTRLRQHVTIGPGFSGTAAMIRKEPEREQQVLAWRRKALRAAMDRTVAGIKELAETPRP
jgi:nitroreductase